MFSKSTIVARRRAIELRFLCNLQTSNPAIKITGKFKGMKIEVSAFCNDCRKSFNRTPKMMITKKAACLYCSKIRERTSSSKTRNTLGLQELLKCIKPRKIELITNSFVSRSELAEFKCLTCKRQWKQYPKALMSCKHGCRRCSNIKIGDALFLSKIPEYLERLETRGFKIDKVPKSAYEVRKFICLKCNHKWLSTLQSVKYPHLVNSGCPKCGLVNKMRGSRGGSYDYKLGKRIVEVAGFEPKALDYILSNTTIKPEEIFVQYDLNTPKIEYKFKGKTHIYHPDFYIPRRNILVEVKSIATLDLLGLPIYKGTYRKICAKAKACVKQGYKLRLLLMTEKGERLRVPEDWYNMDRNQLLGYLNNKYVSLR